MFWLHQIDESLIAGSMHARFYLYRKLGVSPKLHKVIPFSLAWLVTLTLALFTAPEVWDWRQESFIFVGQLTVLAVFGCVVYRLYKAAAPVQWEKGDYLEEMGKTAFFRSKQDLRTASVVVLTSTSINILILKSTGLMTVTSTLAFSTLLVWALTLVMVLHFVSADPPPPESGDVQMLPQGV
jgi:hypothetical protein